ncbi:MAG: bifunctional glutamine synthetase adenylyltransferase/deadenyltransferase, partial [Nitrosospira sp.]|nr:bifunctional glutamine synthetase adenylyltransferase/deadenyltransferase [Nitrosospira sp.]
MHASHSSREIIDSTLPFSRYVRHSLDSEPQLLTELQQNLLRPFFRGEMQAFLDANASSANDERGLHSVLRGLRKRLMLRLAVRDLGGLADLAEVMTSMTDLAEITICFALERHHAWLATPDRYGQPNSAESGITQEMLVIAMGKLGGGELNFSSDVDLV